MYRLMDGLTDGLADGRTHGRINLGGLGNLRFLQVHIFDRTISPTAYWALSLLRNTRRGVRFNER